MQFIDLKTKLSQLRPEIDQAIARVLDHGQFILGPEVAELEQNLALSAQVDHCVTCANGTDALLLALRALEIGNGDCVLLPSFTFAATAESIINAGATPYFVDIQPQTFNLDPDALYLAIEKAKGAGLNPKGVIPVDLFGLPASYREINAFAADKGLKVIADAAQSFGANTLSKPVGSLADVTTTSFFPTKPLGCYGDGGAIFTRDKQIADKLKSLRSHGKGRDKYDNVRIGLNSRLDTIQAAILLVKLKTLADDISKKNDAAIIYNNHLDALEKNGKVKTPTVFNHSRSAWAQYTIVVQHSQRDRLKEHLASNNIPSAVYYPNPLHKQAAYGSLKRCNVELPITDKLASSVLSLPMHPFLTTDEIKKIAGCITNFLNHN